MSPLQTCDDLRPLLGAYILGALEPDEAEAVREHLPGCAACSAEHASLAGLPALLDLATPLAAPDEPLSPAFEEALLDRFARDRETAAPAPAPRRRFRLPRIEWTRPRVAVVSALLAAALTFGTISAFDDDPSQPVASRNYVIPLRAAASVPAAGKLRAHVALYRVRGGTGVHLWASGLPAGPGRVYEMLCEGNGWSASAGTFRADAKGHVEAKLTTAARVGEYESLRVVYRDDRGHTKDVLTGRLF
jgi:anti-sigma factor RsiW